MGVAGLVLGIVGLVGGFIPGINYFAWLLALIGIILSAIAMKKAKSGIAIAGLVLSIIGFVIAISGLICVLVFASAVESAAGSIINGYGY